MQAAIQATRYDDEKPEVIGGVTVPGEETILHTATSNFITDAVAVEQIGVDYATLALNSLTPIRFTIRNTGLNDVTNLTVKLGSGETATLTEKLLPNESITLTVWHHVKDRVTDPSYTITAAGGINENGTVYLDYPDIGISQMEVIAESAGKRTVRMTLYNSSAATLAGGRNREVKLAVYADDLHSRPSLCHDHGSHGLLSERDGAYRHSRQNAFRHICASAICCALSCFIFFVTCP